MPRLIITDQLGQQLIETRLDGGFSLAELRHLAALEAKIQATSCGRVAWRIAGDDGRDLAVGQVQGSGRLGLLPPGTPVLYCEADAGDAVLSVYGTIVGIRAGCYLVAVDHVDSGGRPVPIAVDAELRVPVDTPAEGGPHTLEAVPLAHQVAAE